MIETRARVVEAADGRAWVAADAASACAACATSDRCGLSGLGKVFSRRRALAPVACAGARAGDELLVCVDEGELLRAGLYAYLLPALLAALATALAAIAGLGDALAALAALAGLAGGLLAARRYAPIPALRARKASPAQTSPSQGVPP